MTYICMTEKRSRVVSEGVVFDSDWKYIWLSQLDEGDTPGSQWVEASDIAEQPTADSTAPAKNDLAPRVNSAEAEQP